MTTEMSLGTSKTDITPPLPVRLGGFDFRHEPCVQMAMLVFARCFVFNRQITLTCLSLSPQLMLLTVSAEVVNHYQQWLRSISPHILGIGYSNGMAGYLPDARQIAEGGYEPDTSAYYFYLDAPFAPQAEYRFKEAVMHLSEEHINV